jgi:hypothetical protein
MCSERETPTTQRRRPGLGSFLLPFITDAAYSRAFSDLAEARLAAVTSLARPYLQSNTGRSRETYEKEPQKGLRKLAAVVALQHQMCV